MKHHFCVSKALHIWKTIAAHDRLFDLLTNSAHSFIAPMIDSVLGGVVDNAAQALVGSGVIDDAS